MYFLKIDTPASKVRIITVHQILSNHDLKYDSDIHGFKVIVAACKHIPDIKFCKNHSFIEGHWYSYVKGNNVLLKYNILHGYKPQIGK